MTSGPDGSHVALRALRDQRRRDEAVVPAHLERLGGGRRVFLLEQAARSFSSAILLRRHAICSSVEAVERGVFALFLVEREVGPGTGLRYPSCQYQGTKIAMYSLLPRLGVAPHLVETSCRRRGRSTSRMISVPGTSGTACSTPAAWVSRMRPERHLGAVEELHRGRAADALGAGGADLVAASRARRNRARWRWPRWSTAGRRSALETIDHLEQVLVACLLMGEDEHAQPARVCDAVIEAAAHIGRAALLAALEDERAHLAGLCPLRLERSWMWRCARLKTSGTIAPLLGRMRSCWQRKIRSRCRAVRAAPGCSPRSRSAGRLAAPAAGVASSSAGSTAGGGGPSCASRIASGVATAVAPSAWVSASARVAIVCSAAAIQGRAAGRPGYRA